MELRNLKTFQIAADFLNFTKTAKALNFTQPTVTSQIRALENELNHPLFFRIGKQTYLTSHGEVVKSYADKIFTMIDEMNQKLAGGDADAERKLIIAASETFCTHYFPYIISLFLNQFPNVNIKLVSCHSNEVIQGIDANLYDIGIISGEYHKSGITNIVISEHEDLVLIASKNIYANYSAQEITDHYPFIKYEIAGPFEEQMRNYMKSAAINPKKVIEFSSLEAVKSAVMNDIGVGLISRNLVKKELISKRLFEIKKTKQPIKIKTSLIIATNKLNVDYTMKLIEMIEENWNAMHDIELKR